MILVIDNYDSFIYNIVQYFGELGAGMKIFRNDRITVAEAAALKPEKIRISPCPCSPEETGVSCALIRKFGPKIPVFGVCPGHQSIGEVSGGNVVWAEQMIRKAVNSF